MSNETKTGTLLTLAPRPKAGGGPGLAAWLRAYADRADAGEFCAVAIVTATADNCIGTAYELGDCGWSGLLAGSVVLQTRLVNHTE